MPFTIESAIPARDELLALYGAVGWTAYTRDPDALEAALRGSSWVLVARDGDGRLAGLVRVLTDGSTVVYVQDILVAPPAQRSGVGGALLDAVLERAAGIRQIVLLTDDEPGQRAFYESRGFTEAHDVRPAPLRSFVRLGSVL